MNLVNIDEFIKTIPEDELLIIEEKNPPADSIFMPFVENPLLNAIKYTIESKNIILDPLSKKKQFEFSRFYVDVITNIKCNDNSILLLNNQQIKCNINKITLPIINMQYTSSKIEIVSDELISYDIYLFSDKLRDQLRKKRVINNEHMLFFAGGVYNLFK